VRKVKVAPGPYRIIDEKHRVIATVVKTGMRRDNYPWEFYLADGVHFKGAPAGKERGTTESLKVAVDLIEARIRRYGVEMERVETDGSSA
jgi:hypothetical protein